MYLTDSAMSCDWLPTIVANAAPSSTKRRRLISLTDRRNFFDIIDEINFGRPPDDVDGLAVLDDADDFTMLDDACPCGCFGGSRSG